jgi:predicted esterase
MRELNIPVTTHGRLLIDDAEEASPLRILAGCHGYAQNADEMMELLRRVPADSSWTRVSIQALHRFYRGRGPTTVASWMTRQDRDLLIGDNVAYVDEAIALAAGARPIERLVFCGFSQGVAMAFRAGLLGARKADVILALGGDVPPELLVDTGLEFPRILFGRGARDEWYAAEKMRADGLALEALGARVEALTFDGAHEWHVDFATRAAIMLR